MSSLFIPGIVFFLKLIVVVRFVDCGVTGVYYGTRGRHKVFEHTKVAYPQNIH